jgi:hypothetical protein
MPEAHLVEWRTVKENGGGTVAVRATQVNFETVQEM